MITRYLLPVLAVIALGFALVQMSKAQQKPPPAEPPVEPAKSPYETQLAGSGIVEPESENIAVGAVVPGVVERVFVKVGEKIKPGDPIFRLDDRQLVAELAVRQANLASAAASREKVEQAPRKEELPPVEAKVAEAEANLKDQELMFDRVKRLTAASEEELARRQQAVAVARAQVAKVQGDLNLLRKGAWDPDKLIADAAITLTKAQVEQTRTELGRMIVRAPRVKWTDGPDETEFRVLQVNVRPGEYVGSVPGTALVVLGQIGKLHVRVDIDESEIARFEPTLTGVAKPRGNPSQVFPLTFVRVEPYVIPKRSLTGGNTERVDTRVLQVIYAIGENGKPLFVGQQMDVFLNTGVKPKE